MSFCYSFRKQDVSLQALLGKMNEIIIFDDSTTNVSGVWLELPVSAMLRDAQKNDAGPYQQRFITRGSIRGVDLIEDGESLEIVLHSFASRSDQYLAARIAWEAMNLGATVDKEGFGVITAADLSAESLESAHREWFTLSRAVIPEQSNITLPLYGFLSLIIQPSDKAKSIEALESELVARVEALADAFVCSRLGMNDQGKQFTGCILQPDQKSLIAKDIDYALTSGQQWPLNALAEALGDQVLDGVGCWVFPPANQIHPAIFQKLGVNAATVASAGPSENEWNVIAQGPVLAFLMVATADGKVDKKEVMEFGTVLTRLAMLEQHPSVARMMTTAFKNLEALFGQLLSPNVKPGILLQEFTSLVNQRFSAEDAHLIKSSLMFLAEKVASSSGGFLGLGPKISKDEKEALAVLALLLGLNG